MVGECPYVGLRIVELESCVAVGCECSVCNALSLVQQFKYLIGLAAPGLK